MERRAGAPCPSAVPILGTRLRRGMVIGASFIVPFVVYLRTLAPAVAGGDAGELTVSAHVLGVPHPTGYPLYMLLARLFQFAPVGSVAYRTNLFSAVCAAGMCAVLAFAYLEAGGSGPGALLAALTAGFLSATWGRALRADVYPLHALFVAAIAALFIRWLRSPTSRRLVALAAVTGLALAHHRAALFFALPILAIALARAGPQRGRLLPGAALALLLPLLLYLYLPLRAGASSAANWGDPATLHALARHVTAPESRAPDASPWTVLAGALAGPAASQSTLPGIAVVIAGWALLFRVRRTLWLAATLGAGLSVAWAAIWVVADADAFVLPAYLLLAGCAAVAAEGASRLLSGPGATRRRRALGLLPWAAMMLAFPARLAWANWAQVDRSRDWQPYDAGRLMFAEAAPESLLLLSGESPNGIALYLQTVERRRPDLRLVWVEHARHSWYDADLPLAGLAREAQHARRESPAGQPPSQEQWAQRFTLRAAERFAGRRPTYSNLSPLDLPRGYVLLEGRAVNRVLPGAPDPSTALRTCLRAPDAPDLGLYTDFLFGVVRYNQVPLLVAHGSAPLTVMAQGIVLLRAEANPPAVSPGGLFRVRYQWRCERPVEEPMRMVVDFVQARWLLARDDPGAIPPAEAGLSFGAIHPFMYGVMPLAATPRGTHYEQVVDYVAARHVPPGRYLVRVALIRSEGVSPLQPMARLDLKAAASGQGPE